MSKINQLLLKWPKGTVYTSGYLHNLGFSNELLYQYKNSNWLDSLGKGAFKHKEDKVDWIGGIYALQNQSKLSIHAAGRTALEMKGLTHYLTFRSRNIHLFGLTGERVPLWFNSLQDSNFCHYRATDMFSSYNQEYFVDYEHKNFSIKISSPELAAFEMLYNIPQTQSFDEAIKIFENLTTLRTDLVQKLLENCNSIKVKRLFLYLAEHSDHFWFKDISQNNVDLGSGKRVIDANGKLNRKYNITVPQIEEDDEKSIF